MKFGKHLEGRQLELPEYNGHFINYKALKKLIKQLSVPTIVSEDANDQLTLDDDNESLIYQRLQENRASFFFKLERELEKVNEYYLERESDLRMKFEILNSRYDDLKMRGKLLSKNSMSYRSIRDGIKKFERDLAQLEQFIELNRTGFSKVLKKWDKRSHSHAKDFYLATVVSVQPIFTRNEISKWNDAVLAILMELDELVNKEDSGAPIFYRNSTQSRALSRNSDNMEAMLGMLDTKSTSTSSDTVPPVAPDDPVGSLKVECSPTASLGGLFDIELEIESWCMELLNISKLKDEEPRKNLIRTFVQTKVQSFVEDHLSKTRIDKNLVIRDSITKIFRLLLSTTIDDDSLTQFWRYGKDLIDLTYSDSETDLVFSRHNIFHEAAICPTESRAFVLQAALQQYQNSIIPHDAMKKLLNAQDIHGRTPLHYASELGKTTFVSLLVNSKLLDSTNVTDNESKTPLVLSIINNHIDITKMLVVEGDVNISPAQFEGGKPQFHPLNIACQYNNYEAAKILLAQRSIDLSKVKDSQGLCPLHIVAKQGASSDLIELLIANGADPNEIDGFNKWTPIFYGIQEGHAATVQTLINFGASIHITDEDNFSPLFYALWEGHLSVLNLLLENLSKKENEASVVPSSGLVSRLLSDDQLSLNDSLKDIPDFTLPPPIIPLRKYGHNFLEKKIFVKFTFKPGKGSITLNKDDEMVLSSPGRITLTSNVSHIVPRNLILPIQDDDERVIVFQIDSLDGFDVDFEIYPSFGTRLIAKTHALSTLFHAAHENILNRKHISLPLFDSRLRNVGNLDFDVEVIFPYPGKPLEVTKYETYWKSTSAHGLASNGDATGHGNFVTSSSLSGEFVTVGVVQLNDGTLVTTQSLIFSTADFSILLNDLNEKQLNEMLGGKLGNIPDQIESSLELKTLLNSGSYKFEDLLQRIHPSIQLDIKVIFPTESEINSIPVKISPGFTINRFVDAILSTIFMHVRDLRQRDLSRSIVFSSTNPRICSILNWKQPNLAVIYHMNGITLNDDGRYIKSTPNNLSSMALNASKITYDDLGTISIREAVVFANNNNLLGVVIPSHLLGLTNELIDQIRSHSLLLIASKKKYGTSVTTEDWELDVSGFEIDHQLIFKGNVDM